MTEQKKRRTKPPHSPTDQQRSQVEALSGLGLNHENIASIIGIDDKTLRKYYRKELDQGKAKANAKVSQSLFRQIESGNVAAAMFWLKTQCGWRETERKEHTGEVTYKWKL